MTERIANFVRGEVQKDESLQTRGNCFTAADILYTLVRDAFPSTKVRVITYYNPRTGTAEHAALEFQETGYPVYIANPIRDALFPIYYGPKSSAPSPAFSQMR